MPHHIAAAYDRVDWWTAPHLAYSKGLHDGYAAGLASADAHLVAALTQALGGINCPDYSTAVRRHHRALDAIARRRALDTGKAAA